MATTANVSKRFMQNPVSRFAFFALCWTVVYRVLSFACNHLFGWPLYGWAEDIFMGVVMGLVFALFTRRQSQSSTGQ
jgi:uncharacterized RDD family membrane protein YckC